MRNHTRLTTFILLGLTDDPQLQVLTTPNVTAIENIFLASPRVHFPLSDCVGVDTEVFKSPQKMLMKNCTITTFILLGLTDDVELQALIFIFLFLTYMLSITGNLIIIILTVVDSHLKTPMYFFLKNFSVLEISFTTACIPRYLYNIATGDKIITYNACIIQVFFTDLFAITEFFLLAAMSYDRYVAICKPLHYVAIMSSRVCRRLVFCCWLSGLLLITPPLSLGLKLEFCDSNIIDHFLCDAYPLLKISCSDTWFVEQTVLICAVVTLILTLICVILSYTYIINTVLGFPSSQQRKKAFSTCSSHMIVVSITYGTCMFIYMNPTAKEEVTINKVVSLLISSISPVLNPFIYTLRNKQVKKAFNNSIKRIALFLNK
ncbi:olfactory receptor 6C2-like [Tupaia chinensis]|uniref:olfactory receptor 6C2-like n=1 Tax=Tupaia chinensis TaxID=246437 RepID=UPI000FFBDE46|nr:olfactory receptor 6C2-like [Tupaia chinensis]